MKKLFAVLTLALVMALNAGCASIMAKVLDVSPGQKQKMVAELNVMVPMSDGVKLATDIYRPAAPGKYPVVLCRMPYGTDGKPFKIFGDFFVRHGYIFINQDTRGTFGSEGEYFPLVFERKDGQETIKWISEQPWYNGKIGTWGISYFGYTQWAEAPDNPLITAMDPVFGTGSIFKFVFRGGALSYIQMIPWNTGMENSKLKKEGSTQVIKVDLMSGGYFNEQIRDANPVNQAELMKDQSQIKKGVFRWFEHPGDIANVEALNFDNYYSKVTAPSLQVAGWYDQALGPMLDDFAAIRSQGSGNAKKTRLIIGPWTHGAPGIPNNKIFGQATTAGLKVYGKELIDWYDFWLKGAANGADKKAPITLFVMGENTWRDESEWPLKRTVWTNAYLHSKGNANSNQGDGWLDLDSPKQETTDKFDYDPANPAPTFGGAWLPFDKWMAGSFDQTPAEKRKDVLVFATAPLKEAMEVTGPIKVVLYASSDAKDTDFTAKLVDVYPNGKAYNLADGIIRARYRDGLLKPSALEPGKVYKYEIDMWATSNLFKPGHKILVEISSSNFPQFDRNTNCGGEGGKDCRKVARQVIYHDETHPSHIVLPVIRR